MTTLLGSVPVSAGPVNSNISVSLPGDSVQKAVTAAPSDGILNPSVITPRELMDVPAPSSQIDLTDDFSEGSESVKKDPETGLPPSGVKPESAGFKMSGKSALLIAGGIAILLFILKKK